MDIFSKQYMWRIKEDQGALKMFPTQRFYFWYNDFIFFFFLSEPSFSLLFQPLFYLDSLAAHFSPLHQFGVTHVPVASFFSL